MKRLEISCALLLLTCKTAFGTTLPPCANTNQGYACSGAPTGKANVGSQTTWQMQPAEIATMTGLPTNVDCVAGQATKIMAFSPGWTYIPGLKNMGTWVTANFQIENTSAADATGVELWLGWGNRVAGPFTVKAGQDLFVSGMAADGFQPPTTYADYSPYVYVPESSAAAVTVISSGPGVSIIEFLHGF
jgi:hypothetical protein